MAMATIHLRLINLRNYLRLTTKDNCFKTMQNPWWIINGNSTICRSRLSINSNCTNSKFKTCNIIIQTTCSSSRIKVKPKYQFRTFLIMVVVTTELLSNNNCFNSNISRCKMQLNSNLINRQQIGTHRGLLSIMDSKTKKMNRLKREAFKKKSSSNFTKLLITDRAAAVNTINNYYKASIKRCKIKLLVHRKKFTQAPTSLAWQEELNYRKMMVDT